MVHFDFSYYNSLSKDELKNSHFEISHKLYENFDFTIFKTYYINENCHNDIEFRNCIFNDLHIKNNYNYKFINSSFNGSLSCSENGNIIIEDSKNINGIYICSQGAKSIEFSNTIITNSTFNGEITDKAIFKNVTFENPPEIGDIKFKNCNVDFTNVKFLDTHSSKAIAGFRALNKACRDANYHHGEILFHGYMLEGMGNNLSWKKKDDFVEKLISEGYKKFANYGRSLLKPLISLIIISILIFLINFGILLFDNNYSANSINNKSITLNKELSISYNDNSYNIKSINSLGKNPPNQSCELWFINLKTVFKNSIGPLQLALPKDFITEEQTKCFQQKIYPKSNSSIDFSFDSWIGCIFFITNFLHTVISSAIWFVWFFMIRARFRL